MMCDLALPYTYYFASTEHKTDRIALQRVQQTVATDSYLTLVVLRYLRDTFNRCEELVVTNRNVKACVVMY